MKVLRAFGVALVPVGMALSTAQPVSAAPTVNTRMSAEQCRPILAQPKGVVFIGDSITAMGYDTINTQFTAAGKHVCINGLGGRSTAGGVAVLTAYVNAGVLRPDTEIVMALGTNDVLHASAVQTGITATLALVGNRRLLWPSVYNATGSFGPAARVRCLAGSKVVNSIIATNVKAHPTQLASPNWYGLVVLTNLRLINWLNNGGVHPTATGSYYRTKSILAMS